MYEDQIFEVNESKKRLNGIITTFLIGFLAVVIIVYIFFFRDLIVLEGTPFGNLINNIKDIMFSFNLLGVFLVGLFGGLFFIFFPMEVYLLRAFGSNEMYLTLIVFLIGVSISYSLDYLFGLKLSKLSRKLISPKKFYTIKSYINRWGSAAILIVNGVPFMPSQQVTFILGVFRYNKARLLVLTAAGQIFKALLIAGGYLIFFG